MEYKKFKDEQPEAGRLVEIKSTEKDNFHYSFLTWKNGIPRWMGVGVPSSEQEWRYSDISEPTGPCLPEEASPVSPEQQAAWNNHINPPQNPNPEIVFTEHNGYLVGEDKNRNECFELRGRVAYDALRKLAVELDKGDATPAYPPNEELYKNYLSNEVIRQSIRIEELERQLEDMSAKNECNRSVAVSGGRLIQTMLEASTNDPLDAIDNSLEARNERQESIIKAQDKEIEGLLIEIKSRDKVLVVKDAKITSLLIENETLKARLEA